MRGGGGSEKPAARTKETDVCRLPLIIRSLSLSSSRRAKKNKNRSTPLLPLSTFLPSFLPGFPFLPVKSRFFCSACARSFVASQKAKCTPRGTLVCDFRRSNERATRPSPSPDWQTQRTSFENARRVTRPRPLLHPRCHTANSPNRGVKMDKRERKREKCPVRSATSRLHLRV